MSLEIWTAFFIASLVLVAIPGPTVLLTVSYALTQGRRTAVATALGVALGDFVAMSASLAGLGALVLTSATLFTVLKWVGAAYLVWLGLRLWRTPPTAPDTITPEGHKPAGAVFWHAAAVTALNPKSIAFFIAFVPQFIVPGTPLTPQFALLIATFVTLGAVNSLVYALLADRARRVVRRPAVLRWVGRTGGAALIGMGAMTAALRRAA